MRVSSPGIQLLLMSLFIAESFAPPVRAEEDRLVKAKVVHGTVVDKEGMPIPRVKLWYEYAYNWRTHNHLSVSARTDSQGKFTIEVPAAELESGWRVRQDADLWAFSPKHCLAGVALRKPSDLEEPAEIRIELEPASDSSVVVVDPDGEPVAGVIVEPTNYRTYRGYDMVPKDAQPLVGGRTDANGRVRFPWLARDRMFNVRVTTEKYGVQTQRFTVHAGQPAERFVKLRPVCRIEGRVMAEKPEWASGHFLAFTTEESFQAGGVRPPWPTAGYAEVITNEEGRFEIPVIAAGRLSMIDTVVDEELPFRIELPDRGELPAGETSFFQFATVRLVDIRGSIVTEDTGEALEGIEIHVYYGKMRQGTDVVTDAKGQFTARVMPGKVRFQLQNLHSTKYLQLGGPPQFEVPKNANELKLPPVKVVPSKTVQGRLIDHDDKPVAGADVYAFYRNWLCSWAKAEADGTFTLPKMPVSIKPDAATYRVSLGVGETRYMRDGGVEILPGDPLRLRVRR